MIHIKSQIEVKMRADADRKVSLLENEGLLAQILHNREARKTSFGEPPKGLFIAVLLDGEVTNVPSVSLLVRSFLPGTSVEKWAIRLAEQMVLNAVQFKHNDKVHSAKSFAYADDLLWITYTGHMQTDKDRSDFADAELYKHYSPPAPARGTWNEYEPELF